LARTSLLLLALAGVAITMPAEALDDLNWLSPDADRAAALTTAPAECLARPADPGQAWRVSLGQVAFRSPALLGGLAARSGISCDTCHRNGHGNPAFFIAGVSGAPGTADVTSAIFSQTRGDDTVNPVPIPDLTGAGAKTSFGTVRPTHDLPGFVHSVMVDEFQGQEPAPAVAEGLVAYVAGLTRDACPAEPSVRLTFDHAARELADTYAVLLATMDRDDRKAADFVLRSLNLALGRLAQRFPGAPEAADALPALGRDLGTIRPLIRDDPDAARRSLAAWRKRLDVAIQILSTRESLFDRRAVERFLGAGR
jgi:hypothetical protein